MHLSPNYFTSTATCTSIRVNQLVLLNLKLSNKMLNDKNGSEDGQMSKYFGKPTTYGCKIFFCSMYHTDESNNAVEVFHIKGHEVNVID